MRIAAKYSPTHERIFRTVCSIPKGKVATYGEVAELSGFFGQARLVGYALHSLPPRSGVPWHRVINAQGRISLPDVDGMYERQKALLRKEGVVFIRETVDFRKYGWVTASQKRSMEHTRKQRAWRRSNTR